MKSEAGFGNTFTVNSLVETGSCSLQLIAIARTLFPLEPHALLAFTFRFPAAVA
jgi:hypothetical protein